ncbi:baeRF2 domain-containing protein [Arthrobacter pigmenti]
MELQTIRHIFDADGPFATVYLEGRSPADDAGHQVRLRWDDLRGRLSETGAPEGLLTALDGVVDVGGRSEIQADGRVLVANADGVLLNEAWDAALGAGDAAHFTQQPELGAYVREEARSVKLLVAIVNQHGATVQRLVAAEAHNLVEENQKVVDSRSGESVHKPREGALSHKRIQSRADEAIKHNVQGIAEYLDETARTWRPDMLVLAGEVQGRTALRDELPKALAENYREVESGGSDDQGAQDALAGQLREVAAEISSERARDNAERFEYARAHNLLAEGSQAVAKAAQMGAVETLLLNSEAHAVDEPALLAASTRIDARVGLTESAMADHVAAVLRFEAPDEITNQGSTQ